MKGLCNEQSEKQNTSEEYRFVSFLWHGGTGSGAYLYMVGERNKGASMLLAKSGETEFKYIFYHASTRH